MKKTSSSMHSMDDVCRCGHTYKLHDDVGCQYKNCKCSHFIDKAGEKK